MYRLVTDGGSCGGEAVKKRFAAFFRRAGKEIALGIAEVFRQPGLGFFDAIAGHFQQQVMFIFIAPAFHPLR